MTTGWVCCSLCSIKIPILSRSWNKNVTELWMVSLAQGCFYREILDAVKGVFETQLRNEWLCNWVYLGCGAGRFCQDPKYHQNSWGNIRICQCCVMLENDSHSWELLLLFDALEHEDSVQRRWDLGTSNTLFPVALRSFSCHSNVPWWHHCFGNCSHF